MTRTLTHADIASHHLKPGAPWTFCHGCYSAGRRTAYVLDRQTFTGTPGESGFDATYRLLNPATGNYAEVTRKWLVEGPVGTAGYWMPGTEDEA
jgi:hypothetical protein